MSTKKEKIYISLGDNCQVAHQLQRAGLKGPTYPFDWIISPYRGIRSMLESDFEGFLPHNNLRFVKKAGFHKSYVEDTANGFRFHHDFPESAYYFTAYHDVVAKYGRRITRMRSALNSPSRLIFIRVNLLPIEAQSFTNILGERFPDLDYTLLVLDNKQKPQIEWEQVSSTGKVIHRHLPQQDPYDWRGIDSEWDKVFSDIISG